MFLRSIVRFAILGAACGAVIGGLLVAISLIGGDRVWAGMLLLAGVASWPAGLWPLDAGESAIRSGIWAAQYLPFLGPALNGLILGAGLGILNSVGNPGQATAAKPPGDVS